MRIVTYLSVLLLLGSCRYDYANDVDWMAGALSDDGELLLLVHHSYEVWEDGEGNSKARNKKDTVELRTRDGELVAREVVGGITTWRAITPQGTALVGFGPGAIALDGSGARRIAPPDGQNLQPWNQRYDGEEWLLTSENGPDQVTYRWFGLESGRSSGHWTLEIPRGIEQGGLYVATVPQGGVYLDYPGVGRAWVYEADGTLTEVVPLDPVCADFRVSDGDLVDCSIPLSCSPRRDGRELLVSSWNDESEAIDWEIVPAIPASDDELRTRLFDGADGRGMTMREDCWEALTPL